MSNRYAWVKSLNDDELYLVMESLNRLDIDGSGFVAHVRGYGHRLLLELLQEFAARELSASIFIEE